MPIRDAAKQRTDSREAMRRLRLERFGPIPTVVCAHCGSSFTPARYKSRARYCSSTCRASATRERQRLAKTEK